MTPRLSRNPVRLAIAAGAVALVAGGAVVLSADPSSTSDDGPLRLTKYASELGFPRAKTTDTVTYLVGGFLPCTKQGETATVTAVAADSEVPTTTFSAYVRRIPAAAERVPGEVIEWAPIVSFDGPIDRAVRRGEMRGEITELVAGTRFSSKCPDRPRDVAAPLEEVVLEVEADRQGGRITDVEVTYVASGHTYVARAQVVIEVCGTRIDSDSCRLMAKDGL